MASHPAFRNVPARRRALLAVLALYVLGLLPVLGAAHSHAGEPEHQACQLCEIASQAYETPVPACAPAAAAILAYRPPAPSADPARRLPVPHESRGPPSA